MAGPWRGPRRPSRRPCVQAPGDAALRRVPAIPARPAHSATRRRRLPKTMTTCRADKRRYIQWDVQGPDGPAGRPPMSRARPEPPVRPAGSSRRGLNQIHAAHRVCPTRRCAALQRAATPASARTGMTGRDERKPVVMPRGVAARRGVTSTFARNAVHYAPCLCVRMMRAEACTRESASE